MIRATAGRGERVIVCSQNNRAVDNVLGRLPRELLAVRVGNESRVTAEGVPYLLQRQAADLRTQTLNTSRRSLDAYAGLGDAEGCGELGRRNATLRAAETPSRRRYPPSTRSAGPRRPGHRRGGPARYDPRQADAGRPAQRGTCATAEAVGRARGGILRVGTHRLASRAAFTPLGGECTNPSASGPLPLLKPSAPQPRTSRRRGSTSSRLPVTFPPSSPPGRRPTPR